MSFHPPAMALATLLLATAAFTATTTLADDHVPLSSLPPAARAVVERLTAGGAIEDIERELVGQDVVYEVEYVVDGREWDLEVAENGDVILHREDD